MVGLVLISNQSVNAQTEGFELGLRDGWASGLDFAMPLGSNRLHTNAGFGSNFLLMPYMIGRYLYLVYEITGNTGYKTGWGINARWRYKELI